jgi:hypothetical protein
LTSRFPSVISVAVCTGAVTLMMEFAGSQDCVRSNADRVEKRRVVNVTTGSAGEEGARGGKEGLRGGDGSHDRAGEGAPFA